jgi:hypothetical protein
VGIDPGQTGAMVAVGPDGVTVVALQTWSRCRTPPALDLLPTDVVAVEAQYIGHGAHASIVLVEWTGRLLAAVPAACRVTRPLAGAWRAKVFRRTAMRRDAAKRMAVETANRHAVGLGADPSHDLAEAWCLARYCWGWAMAGFPVDSAARAGAT